MPDETEDTSSPPEEGGKKKGLLADWKGMKGWQKAGVLIGGGALVVAVMIYINGQSSPTATGNSGTPLGSPNMEPQGIPGQGDQYPSVPGPSGIPAQPTPISSGSGSGGSNNPPPPNVTFPVRGGSNNPVASFKGPSTYPSSSGKKKAPAAKGPASWYPAHVASGSGVPSNVWNLATGQPHFVGL
jgi:hypothetical protein